MDAPNEKFRAFIIHLYSDHRKGGPTKNLSMLDLLDKLDSDKLDSEYNRINNLGRWAKRDSTNSSSHSLSTDSPDSIHIAYYQVPSSRCHKR